MRKFIRVGRECSSEFSSLAVNSDFFHGRISLTRKFISEKIPPGFIGDLLVMLAVESDRPGFESQLCAS